MPAMGDIYAIRVVCYNSTLLQLGINTVHAKITGLAGTGASDVQVASGYDALVFASYISWLCNNATYRGVGAKCVSPTPRNEQTTIVHANLGTGGVTSLPSQVSGLIHLATAVAGRGGRGRIFPPFPPTAWTATTGEINAPGLAALTALAGSMPLTMIAGILPNQSTLTFGLFRRAGAVFTPFASQTAESSWATQRRRGDFGRKNFLPTGF